MDIDRAAELVRPGVGIFAHFTGMPGTKRDNINQADPTVFHALGKEYDKNGMVVLKRLMLKKCRWNLLKDLH